MRTSNDALRSLARYMSRAFGDDWEVGFWREEGAFTRPGVKITEAGPLVSGGSRHTADLLQPYAIYAYPEEGETTAECYVAAQAARETLWHAFHIGVEEGRPMRVPLFDYEGVGIDEASVLRRAPDYMRVNDLQISSTQAPDDDKKWTVLAEIRLGWRRAALLPSGSRLAQQLRTDFTT